MQTAMMLTLALAAAEPERLEWTIDGTKREALVFAPSQAGGGPAPVVFVFHGHGGRMERSARKGYAEAWPEAVVVCPQGLPTATGRDPEGKRSGWQPGKGENGDRDLKFFDAALETLRSRHRLDEKRVCVTGHSNGGGFAYLLWAERGDRLAAVAPSSAGARGLRQKGGVKPLPVLHLAGEKDEVVPFDGQKQTIAAVKQLNGCDEGGRPWAKAGPLVGTLYPAKGGSPVVTLVHAGGHKEPDEAAGLIVRFFKEFAGK